LAFDTLPYTDDNNKIATNWVAASTVVKAGVAFDNDIGFKWKDCAVDPTKDCKIIYTGETNIRINPTSGKLEFRNDATTGHTGKYKVECTDGVNTNSTNEFTVTQTGKC